MTIKSDHRALYLQVIDRMKQDIASGVYKEKEKLPSEFELSKSLGVSRATLREALRLLEEDNVIVRRHGVGTFVNSKPVFSSGIEELTSVSDMIRQAGMEPGVVYLSTSESICSEEDVNRFHCNPDDTVISIERVRTANGEPVVYCIDKVPSVYMPEGFLGRKESSIFSALEESGDIRISYAVTFIDPTGYHEEASPILECDPETALLVLKQHHYDENDRLVLYSKNYFRADKFSFHVVRKRL
ncbi:GntR family transcriptional regulator [Planococcus maritimus]|uniref:GntR family transcriptional regulator n=3 Tax=Planococcus TaxID=1372 RepID=A0A0U2Z3S1_9BACL|nr:MULTISPECIES: GntR family transcriptional regulator [Planococcus]ALS73772.1 GntR family transcriptional regulator [Planococcus rifietoensis]MDE0582625.1 GntR family transcriptional regulator [Planococcus sp. A6]MDE4086402.1 GntR family transcriptional regulator [Planococcus maritimus]RLJ90070.1 GntR family transcriptional regulator [Planococcus citreus]